MAVQAYDNFLLLTQIMQATRNLAKNMRDNAQKHIDMATAQNPSVATLGQFVKDSATNYNNIISTAKTWVQANNAQASAAVALLGSTVAELNTYTTPLQTAATNLSLADVSTYPAIITACNAVLATVPAPATIWGW